MPTGDPWPAIHTLLTIEEKVRSAPGLVLDDDITELDVYWVDLIRLLQIFKCWKLKDFRTLAELRAQVTCATYHPYIDSKLRKV